MFANRAPPVSRIRRAVFPRCGSHRARCAILVEMHAPITEEGTVTRVEQVSNLMISSIGVLGVGKLPSLHGLEQ